MFNDIGNAVFEFGGAILNFVNVYRLAKDKKVRGVYYPAWILFTIWGFWNLYYYPSVDCWYSFLAGIFIVTANTAWVILAIRYRKN
jgi:hypothetical protein